MGSEVFSGVPKDETLHVLPQYLNKYKAADQWKEFTDIIGDLVIKGDLNGDASVDGNDVSILLEMVLDGGLTDAQKAVGDLNGDTSVDGNDVSILLEMVLGGK